MMEIEQMMSTLQLQVSILELQFYETVDLYVS